MTLISNNLCRYLITGSHLVYDSKETISCCVCTSELSTTPADGVVIELPLRGALTIVKRPSRAV